MHFISAISRIKRTAGIGYAACDFAGRVKIMRMHYLHWHRFYADKEDGDALNKLIAQYQGTDDPEVVIPV